MGVPIVLGVDRTPHTCMVQAAGEAFRIGAGELQIAMDHSHTLRALLRFVHTFTVQVSQTAYANAGYSTEERLARRLLMTHDRLEHDDSLGVEPALGLLHPGQGPSWTHVMAPDFADRLADFAVQVACRYPWVTWFTPVNEPLTTARLSGLYGFWQPHGTDEHTCFRLLVAQCRAITRAMRAIRGVNPAARLLQTEDLGKIFAPPSLQYQADYEHVGARGDNQYQVQECPPTAVAGAL